MSTSPPKTLTQTQAESLLKALQYPGPTKAQKRRGIRDYCIALLMLDAGLRVGEVVQLTRDDLWFDNAPINTIFIRPMISKNKESRQVPVSDRLHASIVLLKMHVWPWMLGGLKRYAFYAHGGGLSITTRQVERRINLAARRSLHFDVNPHMLRHTFATRLMQQTNIRVVQQLLGHKSLSSTQVYTHPNADDLEKAIKTLNNNATEEKT